MFETESNRNPLESSREIIERAIKDFKPKAIVIMLSGGDDSMAVYNVVRELGIKYDFVIHGVTGTGIKETQDFVVKTVQDNKDTGFQPMCTGCKINYKKNKSDNYE